MNWPGLFAIGQTLAYYNDTETSTGNAHVAGSLDFSLSADDDFMPEVTPETDAAKTVALSNDGSLDFQYTIRTTGAIGGLCSSLNLVAELDGSEEYNGPLSGLDEGPFVFGGPESWDFTASLTDDDPDLAGETCDFDFEYSGWQTDLAGPPPAGFSDIEIISNTVTAGEWGEEEETTSGYSPIADAYVNQNSTGSNYGGNSELKIKSKNSHPENKRTFIRFDFNFPDGTIINSAALKLYMKDAPSEERTYETKRVLASWEERDPGPGDGIDWNNQPSVDGLTSSVSTGDNNPKWLSWEVTPDVQGFVEEIFANYGWRINDSAESEHANFEGKFHSRESNDEEKRPVLEITFTPPEVTTNHLVVNEIYYDVASGKGNDPNNEWAEIYNPTDSEVDVTGWKICEASGCDTIPLTTPIPAHGFAVASGRSSTWEDYWVLPLGAITINLPGDRIGSNGLRDNGDRVILKDASDLAIDAMSYGDDDFQLNPPAPLSGRGKSLARIIKGYDNDLASDWIINASPNPGTNPSVGGVETITFTYQGIEFLGSEPVSGEEGEPNDLPEDIVDEEEIIIQEISNIEGTTETTPVVSEMASSTPSAVVEEEIAPTEAASSTPDVVAEEVVVPEAEVETEPEAIPVVEETPAKEEDGAADIVVTETDET